MVLCSSLYTVQSSLETVQGLCMGEYGANGVNGESGGSDGAAAKMASDAATAVTASSSTSPQPQQQQPVRRLSSSAKNHHHRSSSNNESTAQSRCWSTGTQTARTFPSDRFLEYLPGNNPFFTNNSLYDDNDRDFDGDDDADGDDEEEHNLFKAETAAFFRSCAGEDCLAMPSEEAEAAAAGEPNRNVRSVADFLFAVDTEDGSSLRTPWTRRSQQQGRTDGADGAAGAGAPTRQEPRYLQKPLAAASRDNDDDAGGGGTGTPSRRHHQQHHHSPKKDQTTGNSVHHSHHHSCTNSTRSKRKKRPAYIVLYRPRTPWPLERLDVVWTCQRIPDESLTTSPISSWLSSQRRAGNGRLLTKQQPCTTNISGASNMDLWTGLLQDEERVEIGRITGYNIHSSQQLDQLVNTTTLGGNGSIQQNQRHRARHSHQDHSPYAAVDPTVVHFAKTILKTTGASAAAATNPETTTTAEVGTLSSTSASSPPTPTQRRPDMGPIFLITSVYVCPEYRGTGLGLFLVDVACRRVADPVALVVLSCGNDSIVGCNDAVRRQDKPAAAAILQHDDCAAREVVQLYFGLLGFAPISEQFLARRNGRHCPRVEEVCPHMPRNAVADATTMGASATEQQQPASGSNETLSLQRHQQMTPRQPPLSLPPPS